jgi:iron complex outermembrane receptor protein
MLIIGVSGREIKMRSGVRLSLAMVLASTCLASAAYAQAAAPQDTNAQSANLEAERQSEQEGGSWAGAIIVSGRRQGYVVQDGSSATRTNTPLLEVPQSIQVINSSLIADQDRRTLAEALVNVSGVVATKPQDSLTSQSLIRGFKSEIFLDGLPAYGINATVDPTSLTGVERIEVVKGPTSTVYGGGAGAPLGGLINVVSVRPHGDELKGFVAFRTGSYSTINPYADVNLPLAEGIAMRVTGEYQSADSWLDFVSSKRWSIQPSIAFGLGSPTILTIMGKIDGRSGVEYIGVPLEPALAGKIRRDVFAGAPDSPDAKVRNRFATAELRHEFSDNYQLTVSGRYYKNTTDRHNSFTYTDLGRPAAATPTRYPIYKSYQFFDVDEVTADANLLMKGRIFGGEHQFLVGANYDFTDYYNRLDFQFAPIGTLDLVAPDYDSLSYGSRPAVTRNPSIDKYETIAAYVQDQVSFGPVHLSGSLRYTNTKIRRLQAGKYEKTYNRFIPRVGATLDIAQGVALFAGYATGFRGAVTFNPPPGGVVKPETSISYEVGLKFALNEAHLFGSLAVYELKRRNVPVAVPGQPGVSNQTGEQRSRGIEADATWEPTRTLSVLANYAYTDAIVSDDTTIPVGSELQRVPKNMGRVAVHYRIRSGPMQGLSFGAGLTARDSYEAFLPNRGRVPGYAALDAQLSYDFEPLTITASMVNLTDHKGFDAFSFLTPVAIPIQPRSAYVMLKAKF